MKKVAATAKKATNTKTSAKKPVITPRSVSGKEPVKNPPVPVKAQPIKPFEEPKKIKEPKVVNQKGEYVKSEKPEKSKTKKETPPHIDPAKKDTKFVGTKGADCYNFLDKKSREITASVVIAGMTDANMSKVMAVFTGMGLIVDHSDTGKASKLFEKRVVVNQPGLFPDQEELDE